MDGCDSEQVDQDDVLVMETPGGGYGALQGSDLPDGDASA
jgi:hypothetical protein